MENKSKLKELILAGVIAICGCGGESIKNGLDSFFVLSNGDGIPKDKVKRIGNFMDEKEGKRVTVYYLLDEIKDNNILDAMLNPPAIYDFGDGKPFRIGYDTIEGRNFRFYNIK